MIANPDYKGKWAPRQIPNPDFFEDANPVKSLQSFSKIGFELWTLSSDIYFDNIIISSNELDAVDLYAKVRTGILTIHGGQKRLILEKL